MHLCVITVTLQRLQFLRVGCLSSSGMLSMQAHGCLVEHPLQDNVRQHNRRSEEADYLQYEQGGIKNLTIMNF